MSHHSHRCNYFGKYENYLHMICSWMSPCRWYLPSCHMWHALSRSYKAVKKVVPLPRPLPLPLPRPAEPAVRPRPPARPRPRPLPVADRGESESLFSVVPFPSSLCSTTPSGFTVADLPAIAGSPACFTSSVSASESSDWLTVVPSGTNRLRPTALLRWVLAASNFAP